MNNELRNRALHLIAEHMNTNSEGIKYFSYNVENVTNLINANRLSNSVKTAINNALVAVNFTMGEIKTQLQPALSMEVVHDLDNLKYELKSILSEINTKEKEKEAEEKRKWLANYEAERGENFVCPHNNDL
jgi:hypothetical protein